MFDSKVKLVYSIGVFLFIFRYLLFFTAALSLGGNAFPMYLIIKNGR